METHIGLPYRTGRLNFKLLKIRDGGRPCVRTSATVRPISTKFDLVTHIGPLNPTSNRRAFQNPIWQTAAIWKNWKTVISSQRFTCSRNQHEIWHIDAYWPCEQVLQSKFSTFKNPKWRRRHLEKLKNGHDSATVRPIGTKVGLLTHIGPPNWTDS